MRSPVKRRVIHLAGYDPMTPRRFHARFSREAPRFRAAWGGEITVGELEESATTGRWSVTGEGPGWRVETDHILLRWDDLIEKQLGRPALARWPLGFLAFLDFVWHGALWRYLRHGPRYLLFFLFPYLVMALCALGGVLVGALLSGFGLLTATLVGLGVTAGLLLLAGKRLSLDHLLDDWIFASDLVRRLRPDLEERLALGVRLIEETPDDSELIVIGHSLGAALAMEMLSRAVRDKPQGRPIQFLALGSSVLKLALHRGARRLRADVEAVANSPRVTWAEFQSVSDVMNFFKTDPVAVLGLSGRSPIVRKASFSKMLEPAYYRSIRYNFFRLHCQFISGNDRRAPYDYLMTVAGPFSLKTLAEEQDGALGWVDHDGGLTEAGRARAG